MSNTKILTYTFGVIILFFIYSSFFTVDQTKQAIVLQFGEPKRVINKPGLFTTLFGSPNWRTMACLV